MWNIYHLRWTLPKIEYLDCIWIYIPRNEGRVYIAISQCPLIAVSFKSFMLMSVLHRLSASILRLLNCTYKIWLRWIRIAEGAISYIWTLRSLVIAASNCTRNVSVVYVTTDIHIYFLSMSSISHKRFSYRWKNCE